MTGVTELNHSFGINEQLVFNEQADGLIIADVANEYADARIALQGAQVLQWSPKNHAPVIWLSPDAKYARGKSVRGGIPICWPWFGTRTDNPALPSHGFARTNNWKVKSSSLMTDGRIQLRLCLPEDESTRELWPYKTELEVFITVGETLDIELHTVNRQDATIDITEALHTYFAIGDIDDISIHGLEDTEYVDKVDGEQRKLQQGPVRIDNEVDRVYLGTRADCIIRDSRLKRDIHITKNGSNSTVVWNPWIDKAKKLGDMGEPGYRGMLCVESGNALEDVICLGPDEKHVLHVSYRVESHS